MAVRTLDSYVKKDTGGYGPRRSFGYDPLWNKNRVAVADRLAKRLGVTFLEAERLIYQVERAGLDYDRIDWDQMLGGDLSYSEMVKRVRRMIGGGAPDSEAKTAEVYYRWVLKKAEEDPEAWQDEVYNAERAMMEASL